MKLKEGLGKKIYDECLKGSGEGDKEMKKSFLAEIIAQPGSSKRFNNNLNVSSIILKNNGDKAKNAPVLKTKVKGKEKIYDKKEMKEKRDHHNHLHHQILLNH